MVALARFRDESSGRQRLRTNGALELADLQTDLSRNTVRKYLRRSTIAQCGPREPEPCKLHSFKPTCVSASSSSTPAGFGVPIEAQSPSAGRQLRDPPAQGLHSAVQSSADRPDRAIRDWVRSAYVGRLYAYRRAHDPSAARLTATPHS
jgi:hypothetical protein